MVTLRVKSEKLLGRRLIYLSILLAVTIPMIWRISFKERASSMVRDVFTAIESLPPGARVLVVYDFDPGTEPEIKPMADAFTRHLCLKGAKLYWATLWPTGPVQIDKTIRDVLKPEFPDYRYGVDYVNLGYVSGNEGVIALALTDFRKAFVTDAHNIPTSDSERLPIMQLARNIRSFNLIVDCSGGYPGLQEWIQYAAVPGRVTLLGGSVAVGTPELFPYVPEQCLGFLAGIKGAAEYEQLLLERYPQLDRPQCRVALERMGPQTVAHLAIIFFILLGNGLHLLRRGREES